MKQSLTWTAAAVLSVLVGGPVRTMADETRPAAVPAVASAAPGDVIVDSDALPGQAPLAAGVSYDANETDPIEEDCQAAAGACDGGDPCGPRFLLRGGWLYMQRKTDPAYPLVVDDWGNGPKLLDAADLDYPMRGGPEVDLIVYGRRFDFEFRYFALENFSSDFAFACGPHPMLNYATPVFGDFNGPTTAAGSVTSELRNFEFNVRRQLTSCLTAYAGYRHLDLKERFYALFNDGFVTSEAVLDASNQMDGFQLGCDAVLWSPGERRFRVEAFGKVGVLNNAMSNTALLVNPAADISATAQAAAFVCEGGLSGVYQITPHVAGRLGYQMLLLDGMALATQQSTGADFVTLTSTVQHSGTALYHGLLFGLDLSW